MKTLLLLLISGFVTAQTIEQSIEGVVRKAIDEQVINKLDSIVRKANNDDLISLDVLVLKIDSIVRAVHSDIVPIEPTPVFQILSPVNGATIQRGQTVTVELKTNVPVSRHQVYLNGDLIDTDGPNYTPAKFTPTPGNYVIRVDVTSNQGIETRSVTINVE